MATDIALTREKKVIRISRFQIGVNVVVQMALLLALVLMANYLSFNHFKRWDFSRNQKYLLTDQTKQLLAGLKKPVKAVMYFSSAQDIYGDVDALLREYEYASKKKLTKEVVDPYRNFSRARELAATYKIQERDNIVILDYEGRSKFVNAQ